jgi:cytochrome c oxidase subunit I
VVGHFHFTMLAALQFGLFAGLYFWFPKMFGRTLSERIGRWHFWLWFTGFVLTFLPQLQLGLAGMPRRIADYSVYAPHAWTALNQLSTAGAAVLAVAGLLFIWNVVASLRGGLVAGDDPLAGQQPGVGLHLPAAFPQLPRAAPGLLRTARVRPAPRPGPAGDRQGHRPADQAAPGMRQR